MDLAEFDYHLPPERIAQQPLADRAASRMLVLHRREQRWEDRLFRDLPAYLGPGDCLVLNDSKVFPSRLFGHRTGVRAVPIGKNNPKRHEYLSGQVEVFLLRPQSDDARTWTALVRPGRKLRSGERIRFDGGVEAEILEHREFGERLVRFEVEGDLYAWLDTAGHTPLPPYIDRPDTAQDRDRYQTVYAKQAGSAAAPTAGLHFTPEVLEACRGAGSDIACVTLHVGLGTFQPLHTEIVEKVELHAESYRITEENAAKLRAARRLVCVGTTSVRTIETAARGAGFSASSGDTSLYIYPGFAYRAVGAMLTNFHLPKSSLILLVAAFAGREFTLAAYRHAVAAEYRFYSYGDCMLIV